MCALIGSFNPNKFLELYELNAYRGALTSSLTIMEPDQGSMSLLQRFPYPLPIKADDLGVYDKGSFFLGHSQAPTMNSSGIHPAEYNEGDCFLWHNGILKERYVKLLAEQLNVEPDTWDTQLLLQLLVSENNFAALSKVDGTFACFMYIDSLKRTLVFRNALSPLWYDDDLNFSSTKFKGSKPLPSGRVFIVDVENRKLTLTEHQFDTYNNPYSL